MSFTQLNLNKNILKALDICGYKEATPIQEKAIPVILEGKDLVACAQTGTGKTAAFVLPALDRLSNQQPSRQTKILILTPTRELAAQITKAATQYGKFLRYNIVSIVGGMSYQHQIRDLSRGANIIVATPGRLLDHIEAKRIDLSHIEMLVLDEADRMLDMGFIDDVKAIAKLTPHRRQTLLFSATADKQLTTVIREIMNEPIWIDLSNKKLTAPKITQEAYKTKDAKHKMQLLKHFMNDANIYKAIIFSATKVNADKLATQLRHDGYAAAALHGDLRQNVRNRTIDQLRKGKIQFLVATDVAARGIDINDVTHVINYDMPRFCEDYVHRIGRTGRAGKSGKAISFVAPADFKHLQRIERYIGQRLQLMHHVDGISQPETQQQEASPFFKETPKKKRRDSQSFGDRPRKKRRDAQSFNERPRRKREDEQSFDERPRRKREDEQSFGERPRRKRQDEQSFHERPRRKRQDEQTFGERPKKKRHDEQSFHGKPKKKRQDEQSFGESSNKKRPKSKWSKKPKRFQTKIKKAS